MKILALKTLYANGVTTLKNTETIVDDTRGKQLIRKGYAVLASGSQTSAAEAASTSGVTTKSPLPVTHRTGGQTGEASAPSLSPPARPRGRPKSTKPKADAK